jgi:hypothetical protein
MNTLREDLSTRNFVISGGIWLSMRNVWVKSCREKHNTHFVFSKCFPKNRAVYEVMWKYIYKKTGHSLQKILRLRFACWINKARHTQNM